MLKYETISRYHDKSYNIHHNTAYIVKNQALQVRWALFAATFTQFQTFRMTRILAIHNVGKNFSPYICKSE